MIKAIIFDYYRTLYLPEQEKVPQETLELLQRLKIKGIKLGLVSKKEEGREAFFEKYKFNKLFLFIKMVEEKQAEDFEQAIRALNCKKEEILIVGDRINKEITTGNMLGLKTVWFQSGKYANDFPKTLQEKPTYIIKDLKEIEGLLNIIPHKHSQIH